MTVADQAKTVDWMSYSNRTVQQEEPDVDIKVLGALSMTTAGKAMTPSAAKPRQILALLALRAGEVVPVPTLIEEVWGEDPPRSVTTTLQTYILQLRRKIAANSSPAEAKSILSTRYSGYQLNADQVTVDADAFTRKAETGARCAEIGDHASASRVLTEALEMWRGQVLVDVIQGPSLSVEATRLEQVRLATLEARVQADLDLGRHQMLLGELSMLVARYPMHEGFCAKLMLALYRSGQQWRALSAYQDLRSVLGDDLGVDPSPQVGRLHQAILETDPNLYLPEEKELVYGRAG